jgi:hypothetical protein
VHAESRVHLGGVGIAVLAFDQGPVGVKLLGQDHGQAGLHALPEVEPVDGDGHRAVLVDANKGRGLLGRLEAGCGGCPGRRHGLRLREQRKGAQRKTTGGRDLEEAAALQGRVGDALRDILRLVHEGLQAFGQLAGNVEGVCGIGIHGVLLQARV